MKHAKKGIRRECIECTWEMKAETGQEEKADALDTLLLLYTVDPVEGPSSLVCYVIT